MAIDLRGQLQKIVGDTYELERELSAGGMARVFIGTETALGRKVVIKVLPPEIAAGVKVERFKREIQFLARLNHPHIVPMLAAGGEGGLSYYVMPFMQGESLRARLLQHGALPQAEVIRTFREVATALSFAHQNAIVHRDIKPDNVLLIGGSAMVTDFGVAKALSVSTGDGDPNALTSLGIALGTPSYIAPEQATADPTTDHRADLYSLGATVYEMLTGRTPFSARTPQAMLVAHISDPPVPVIDRNPEVFPSLNALVMRCLEKSPDMRPQTAEELVRLIDAIATPSGHMAAAVVGAERAAAELATTSPAAQSTTTTASYTVYLLLAATAIIAIGVLIAKWIIARG